MSEASSSDARSSAGSAGAAMMRFVLTVPRDTRRTCCEAPLRGQVVGIPTMAQSRLPRTQRHEGVIHAHGHKAAHLCVITP